GKSWSLALDLEGFDVVKDDTDPTGTKRYITATNPRAGITASIWMEPAVKDGGSEACRSVWWDKEKKSPVARKDVKLAEMGPLAIVEFTVPEFHGAPVRQKNYHAYLAHDSIWIDIHLSKSDAKPSDEAAFKKILKSVHVGERSGTNVRTELALASQL